MKAAKEVTRENPPWRVQTYSLVCSIKPEYTDDVRLHRDQVDVVCNDSVLINENLINEIETAANAPVIINKALNAVE